MQKKKLTLRLIGQTKFSNYFLSKYFLAFNSSSELKKKCISNINFIILFIIKKKKNVILSICLNMMDKAKFHDTTSLLFGLYIWCHIKILFIFRLCLVRPGHKGIWLSWLSTTSYSLFVDIIIVLLLSATSSCQSCTQAP